MAWLWKSKKTLPPLRFSSDLVHESEAFQQAYHSILTFFAVTKRSPEHAYQIIVIKRYSNATVPSILRLKVPISIFLQ